MFRVLNEVLRRSGPILNLRNSLRLGFINRPIINSVNLNRKFSLLNTPNVTAPTQSLLLNPKVQDIANNVTRSVTKFSWRKGKRKSVRCVLNRFYRLNWGAWIRTKSGRHKKLWKKSGQRIRRLRQHVFCNGQQSYLLDKMVGPYWRKPRYYVDDPYEPYHSREEFTLSAMKPKPYFPKE